MLQRGHWGSSSGQPGPVRQAATSKGNSSSSNTSTTHLPTHTPAATHTQPLCRSSSTAGAAWSTAGRPQPHGDDPRVSSSCGKDPIVWLYGDVDLRVYGNGVRTAGCSRRNGALDSSDLQEGGGAHGRGGKEDHGVAPGRGLFRYGSLPASAVRQLLMHDHKYGSHDDMEYGMYSRDGEDDTARAPDRLAFRAAGDRGSEATDSGDGVCDAPSRIVRTSSGKAAGATRIAENGHQARTTGIQHHQEQQLPPACSAAAGAVRLRHGPNGRAQGQPRRMQEDPAEGGEGQPAASPQGPSTPTAGSSSEAPSSSQGNPAATTDGAWSSSGSSTSTSSDEYDGTDTASDDLRSPTSPSSTPTGAHASACSAASTPTAAATAALASPLPLPHAPPHLARLQPTEPPVPRPPPDVRYYTDGRTASYRMALPYKLLAQATLAAYVGWPYALVALAVGAVVWGSGLCVALLVVLAATVALPAPPRPWESFLALPVFRLWRAYFNYSLVYDELPDLTRPYIYVMSPHGAFPLSQVLAASLGLQLWPGHPIHCLAASCVFAVPLWRHVMAWMGAAPASHAAGRRLLSSHGSIAVMAGGIAEMYEAVGSSGRGGTGSSADGGGGRTERIKLLGRRGFVRMALEMGVDIIPVYHYGNSRILGFGPRWAWLRRASRSMRVALGAPTGVWGLPVPHPQPLMMAIGRPISVAHTDLRVVGREAFEAAVDKTLQQVVGAFRELYGKRHSMYGRGPKVLEVC